MGFLEKNINTYKLPSIVNNYLLGREILKQSIFLDTVMGFSQKTGYADFIIINDRSGKPHIKVYSIKKLYNKFKKINNIEKYIKGFNEYNVNSFKNVVFNNNDDVSFIKIILEEFKKYKVAIYASFLTAKSG
jgi:hypothetical protein